MLINKFKLKYGNKPTLNKYIDNEVHRFLNNDRLTEDNLKGLDSKIGKEADKKDRQSQIADDRKSQRSASQQPDALSRKSQRSTGSRGLRATDLTKLNSQADRQSQRSRSNKGGYIPGVTRPRNVDPARSVTSSQLDRQTEIERFTEINENDEWNAI